MGTIGFVGLGNMGRALATNLVGAGAEVVAYDLAGADRCPEGASFASGIDEVARRAGTVVLSLPDGTACLAVARAMAEVPVPDRRLSHVVDTSTLGVAAARSMSDLLAAAGIAYVDAPVSGGVAGARARTLMVIYAGPPGACRAVESVLSGLSDRRRRVGDRPGMGQALKLANNFLSATALVATSEAVAFGLAAGLDMSTMLDVLNGASGQNTATADKFPAQVLTGRYASGFVNTLMAKDLELYLAEAELQGRTGTIGPVTAELWDRFAAAQPGADFTRIFPFVSGARA